MLVCGRYVSPDQTAIERAWHIGRGNNNPFTRNWLSIRTLPNVQTEGCIPLHFSSKSKTSPTRASGPRNATVSERAPVTGIVRCPYDSHRDRITSANAERITGKRVVSYLIADGRRDMQGLLVRRLLSA
jgi:hypothetical protein